MKIYITCLAALLMGFVSFAQQTKYDVLLKINGDEAMGKVTEINSDDIKFIHKDETLSYTIKKSDILKVTFASGRIEFFNKPPLSSEEKKPAASSYGAGPEAHHNKVAILPFHYIIDKQDAGETMTYKVQSEAFAFLSKHIGLLTLQDPTTTNALLIKAGISQNNIRGYTMGEICNILQVEYVVQGTITQNKASASTYSSQNASYKNNNGARVDKNGNIIGSIFGNSGSQRSSSVTTSSQSYQTAVTLNVFNDKGETAFSQDHTSFWNTDEAYKITLQFLLKKTPIYKK